MEENKNIYTSFIEDMYELIDDIECNHDKCIRYSKKRKIDKLRYVIDESSIIYDSDDSYEFKDLYENKKSRVFKKYSKKINL